MEFKHLIILLTIHFSIVTIASAVQKDLIYSLLGASLLALTWAWYFFAMWMYNRATQQPNPKDHKQKPRKGAGR